MRKMSCSLLLMIHQGVTLFPLKGSESVGYKPHLQSQFAVGCSSTSVPTPRAPAAPPPQKKEKLSLSSSSAMIHVYRLTLNHKVSSMLEMYSLRLLAGDCNPAEFLVLMGPVTKRLIGSGRWLVVGGGMWVSSTLRWRAPAPGPDLPSPPVIGPTLWFTEHLKYKSED